MEHRVLARQLRGILGGEGDGNIPLAVHGQPGHLLLKSGDEVAAAQQQGILLRLAALKGYAVHEALKVQHHLVAHGGLLRVLLGEMILQVFPDGGGNIVVGQLHLGPGGGETLVLPQLHLRVEVDKGAEYIALGPDGLHGQLRGPGHADVLLAHGLHQSDGEGVIHRILVKHIGSVLFLHLLPGGQGAVLLGKQRLAPLIGLLQRLFPGLLFHLNGQHHPAVFFIFPFQQHTASSSKFDRCIQYNIKPPLSASRRV